MKTVASLAKYEGDWREVSVVLVFHNGEWKSASSASTSHEGDWIKWWPLEATGADLGSSVITQLAWLGSQTPIGLYLNHVTPGKMILEIAEGDFNQNPQNYSSDGGASWAKYGSVIPPNNGNNQSTGGNNRRRSVNSSMNYSRGCYFPNLGKFISFGYVGVIQDKYVGGGTNVTSITAVRVSTDSSAAVSHVSWIDSHAPGYPSANNSTGAIVWIDEYSVALSTQALAGGHASGISVGTGVSGWTLIPLPDTDGFDIAYAPGIDTFVIVGTGSASKTMISSSTGGYNNWEPRVVGVDGVLRAVAWSPSLSRFVAVGSSDINKSSTDTEPNDGYVYMSSDGIAWTHEYMQCRLTAVTWIEELGIFLAAGYGHHFDFVTSEDGLNWTKRRSVAGTGDLTSLSAWYKLKYDPYSELVYCVSRKTDGAKDSYLGSFSPNDLHEVI